MITDDLIDRVERGTGGDGALCAEIDCLLRFPDLKPATPESHGGRHGHRPGDIETQHGFLQAGHYTSSVDDVLSLIQAKLPGTKWEMYGGDGVSFASMRQQSAYAATPARALLAAALRVMRVQEKAAA